MGKSGKGSASTSSERARDSRKRPGDKRPASPPSQIDELTGGLIGSMKRLSGDETRRKKVAQKLF